MTYDELLELARRFEGKTLETVTGKRFRVGIYGTDRVTVGPPRSGS